jgi:predicted molibdopterin-dependent oxidoreductase YjgC
MTDRCRTHDLHPTDVLEISTADAADLDLSEGDMARVISRYGAASLPVHVTKNIRSGELFATFHSSNVFLNAVTGPYVDADTSTPEYKVTAVRIEKA